MANSIDNEFIVEGLAQNRSNLDAFVAFVKW